MTVAFSSLVYDFIENLMGGELFQTKGQRNTILHYLDISWTT